MIPFIRRRWAGLAAFFLPLFLAVAAASGAQITVGPLLELPGTDTMTVVWETDSACAGSVIVRGPSGTEREILSPVAGTRHVATIAGLAPDTRYEYAVRADGDAYLSLVFSHAAKTGAVPRRISRRYAGKQGHHKRPLFPGSIRINPGLSSCWAI